MYRFNFIFINFTFLLMAMWTSFQTDDLSWRMLGLDEFRNLHNDLW